MIAINHLFIKDATAPVTPAEYYYNAKADVIAIEVSGTFASASLIAEGKVDKNAPDWTPLAVINLSDYTLISDGEITMPGIYEVGAEGIQYFRVRLAAVSGGALTAFCRAVTTGV